MKKPKVSIIIPVYNGSNYVKEAIESALKQTYENIEVIVINDGSNDKDRTKKACLSFGKKIRYYEKENGGVSTALNFGISKMNGDYFSWLSHDDLYLPNKVETEINYLVDNNLVNKKIILYSDYGVIDSASKFLFDRVLDHEMLKEKPEYSLLRAAINGLTLLIPKQAFKEIDLFNEELRAVQDYELWYRMMDKYRFIHLPEVLVQTRIHPNQVTNTSPKVRSEGNEFWTMMIKSLNEKDMIRLEGSVEAFFLEMHKFLLDTPYDETRDYVNREYKQITGKNIPIIKSPKAKREKLTPGLYSRNIFIRAMQITKYEGPINLLKRVFKKIVKRK